MDPSPWKRGNRSIQFSLVREDRSLLHCIFCSYGLRVQFLDLFYFVFKKNLLIAFVHILPLFPRIKKERKKQFSMTDQRTSQHAELHAESSSLQGQTWSSWLKCSVLIFVLNSLYVFGVIVYIEYIVYIIVCICQFSWWLPLLCLNSYKSSPCFFILNVFILTRSCVDLYFYYLHDISPQRR